MQNKSPITVFFLSVFLIFAYVRPYEFIAFLEPLKIAKLAILVALIFSFFEVAKKAFIWKEASFRLFLFIIILAISLVPISAWKFNSINFLMASYIKIFCVFYIMVIALNDFRKLNLIIGIIFFCGTLVSCRIIHAFIIGQVSYDIGGIGRVIGISSLSSDNANDLALMLAMLIPLGIYMIYSNRRVINKALFFVLTLLNCLGLLFTGSRGGYLGFIISMFVFFLMMYKNKKIRLFIGIGIVAITVIFILPAEYKTRFISIFDNEQYSYTDEKVGRIAIWKRGLHSIALAPQGVGIANYSLTEGQRKIEQGISGRWNVAHNSYIEVGAELGILGLIIYLLFVLSSLINARKIVNYAGSRHDFRTIVCARAITASIVSFIVSSLFLSQAYQWSIYIFVALLTALKNIVINNKAAGSVSTQNV